MRKHRRTSYHASHGNTRACLPLLGFALDNGPSQLGAAIETQAQRCAPRIQPKVQMSVKTLHCICDRLTRVPFQQQVLGLCISYFGILGGHWQGEIRRNVVIGVDQCTCKNRKRQHKTSWTLTCLPQITWMEHSGDSRKGLHSTPCSSNAITDSNWRARETCIPWCVPINCR
jgi:hypothetical protein